MCRIVPKKPPRWVPDYPLRPAGLNFPAEVYPRYTKGAPVKPRTVPALKISRPNILGKQMPLWHNAVKHSGYAAQ